MRGSSLPTIKKVLKYEKIYEFQYRWWLYVDRCKQVVCNVNSLNGPLSDIQ